MCRVIIQSLQIQKLNITQTRLEFFQILNIKRDAYHAKLMLKDPIQSV